MKGPDKISQSPPPLYHSITFHFIVCAPGVPHFSELSQSALRRGGERRARSSLSFRLQRSTTLQATAHQRCSAGVMVRFYPFSSKQSLQEGERERSNSRGSSSPSFTPAATAAKGGPYRLDGRRQLD